MKFTLTNCTAMAENRRWNVSDQKPDTQTETNAGEVFKLLLELYSTAHDYVTFTEAPVNRILAAQGGEDVTIKEQQKYRQKFIEAIDKVTRAAEQATGKKPQ